MAGATSATAGGSDKHEVEVARLRERIAALVQQAKILLHGEAALRQQAPKSAVAKRADRDREMEAVIEKSEWYRKEIKRLRPQLEAMHDPHLAALGAEERDPMELLNLLVEKRKELQRLKKDGEGLDKIAEAQRRAEEAQNAMSPEVQDKLNRIKGEVEQQKRLNVKLQAERQKVGAARKKAEEQVRVANGELRSKAAELRPRPSGRPADHGNARQGAKDKDNAEGGDAKVLKQLRRDIEILQEALRQDERKFKAAHREDSAEVEYAAKHAQSLRASIAEQEATIAELRTQLENGGGARGSPAGGARVSPGGGARGSTPGGARGTTAGRERGRPQERRGASRATSAAPDVERPPLMPHSPTLVVAA